MQDYSVPDRPDRDRLIRIEGAHALRDAAARMNTEQEDEGHARWKEEQERKKVNKLKVKESEAHPFIGYILSSSYHW